MVYKALTIAGSDSGGCAGIQADLKTFAALGVHGMSVITALTSQNTLGVAHVEPVSLHSVTTQVDAVLSDIGTDAVKLGMLFSTEIVNAVADCLERWKTPNVVLDPVMVSTTGAILLQEDAIEAIKTRLFPLSRVITPNLPEACVLTGMEVNTDSDKREVCVRLFEAGARSVYLKGGHEAGEDALDLWYDGHCFHEFSDLRVNTPNTHGTGCTFSSAIAAFLARKFTMEESLRRAKSYITGAIKAGAALGIGAGAGPVDHFWEKR